jgi:transposase
MEKSRVVLEACAEAFAVADMALKAGHDVTVVPATLAPSLGVGHRGVKTDKRDAQTLSLASCRMGSLPSVHIPSLQARELRALMASREAQVKMRTMLVNHVRGWLRTQLMRVRSGSTPTFPARVREAALARPAGLPLHIERNLQLVEAVSAQIAEADAELEQLVDGDAVCQRLMTVPGVGPVTAATFRSTVDDCSRFKSAHAIESYVGLTPSEHSSGETVRRGRITRAGSGRVRTTLVQAAWTAWRTRPDDPMVKWSRALAERRPKQVAAVALARKMAGILFAIWRDASTYNPAHQR